MEGVHSLESSLSYLKRLVNAGLDGIGAAGREIEGGVFGSPARTGIWTPAAIGATIGMFTTGRVGRRRSASRMATGGLVGSVVGFGAGVAWASRRYIRPAVRSAVRRVNAVRDARWLEMHPIDYA